MGGPTLNLSAFSRARFVMQDGTLTREATLALQRVQQILGGPTGVITADTVSNTPSGGITATDVQGAIDQLDAEKQPLDATLTAVAGAATAANKLIYWTGVDAAAVCDFTAFARTVVAAASASAARLALGLVIGTDVQAHDAELDAIAALVSAANKIPRFTGSGTADMVDFSTDATMAANSDTTLSSQKAVRSYVETAAAHYGHSFMLMGA